MLRLIKPVANHGRKHEEGERGSKFLFATLNLTFLTHHFSSTCSFAIYVSKMIQGKMTTHFMLGVACTFLCLAVYVPMILLFLICHNLKRILCPPHVAISQLGIPIFLVENLTCLLGSQNENQTIIHTPNCRYHTRL